MRWRNWPSSSSVATTSAPVDEARAEHVEDVRAFGRTQGPGGRRTGLLMPGSGPLTTVEGSPWHPQRSARRRHDDAGLVLPVFIQHRERILPSDVKVRPADRCCSIAMFIRIYVAARGALTLLTERGLMLSGPS